MTLRECTSNNSRGQGPHSGKRELSDALPQPFLHLPRRATLALALALALLPAVAGCDQSAAQRPTHPAATQSDVPASRTTVPPTATPAGLPAFADWRAAYLAGDGFVHVVTLDGKTDLVGPALPRFKINGLSLASAGASPDGQLLAYASSGVVITNMAGHSTNTREVLAGAVADMAWSPDGRQVALSDGGGGLSLLRTTADARTPIPGIPLPGGGNPILGMGGLSLWGWLDKSHLAIGGYPLSGTSSSTGIPTAYALGSLDVTSGALRTIATISSPGLGAPRITVAPDGSHAIFSNARFQNDPFTPIVDEIDTATGAITPLPAILRATGSGHFGPEYTSAAWRPGTHQLAVSTGFLPNNDLKAWLLDLDRDTAMPLLNGQYVAQWSPDGATLVISTANSAAAGFGPYDVSAVTFGPSGQPHVTLLTNDAMSFPFLGFVRTA